MFLLSVDKLTIEFIKSRPRHSNDNALAESKNGSVIRKHLGYDHIPGLWAPQFNDFHRPCLFPVPHIDSKGKVKKRYPYEEMRTLTSSNLCQGDFLAQARHHF